MGQIGLPYRVEAPTAAHLLTLEPADLTHGTGLLPPWHLPAMPGFEADPRIAAMMDQGAPAASTMQNLVGTGDIMDQAQTPDCSAFSFCAVKGLEDRVATGVYPRYDAPRLFSEGGGTSQGGVMQNMCAVGVNQGVVNLATGQRSKIASYLQTPADPAGFVAAVQAAIAAQKAVQVALLVEQDFSYNSSGPMTNGYHAVSGIGYDQTWLVFQNSWGSAWGQGGIGRVQWSYLTQQNLQSGYVYGLVVTDTIAPAPIPTPTPTPTPIPPNDAVNQILALVNQQRAAAGVQPVKLQKQLMASAQGYAGVLGGGAPFSHTGPDGSTPFTRIKAQGYAGGIMGENIAEGFATPQAVMDAWMNSPGHKANIQYGPYTQIGIGFDNRMGGCWVQDWGAGGADDGGPPVPVPPVPVPPVGGPTIASYSPNPVAPGAVFTIQGQGFETTARTVVFTGDPNNPARIQFWSDTEIQCIVPAAAVTGPFGIDTASGKTVFAAVSISGGVVPAPLSLSFQSYSLGSVAVATVGAPFTILLQYAGVLPVAQPVVSHGAGQLTVEAIETTGATAKISVVAPVIAHQALPVTVTWGSASCSGPNLIVQG